MKEKRMIYKEFPNLYCFGKNENYILTERIRGKLQKVQREVEEFKKRNPEEAKQLQKEMWGTKGAFVLPVFIAKKTVLFLAAEYIFYPGEETEFQSHWLKQNYTTGKTIYDYRKAFRDKKVIQEIIDQLYQMYIENKSYIASIQDFSKSYRKVKEKDSLLYYTNPTLYNNTHVIQNYVNKHKKIFTTKLSKDDIFRLVNIVGFDESVITFRIPFFKEEMVYDRTKGSFKNPTKTVWEDFGKNIEQYRYFVSHVSFQSHPMLREMKEIFSYRNQLEELYPLFEDVQMLEKSVEKEVRKTKKTTEYCSLCEDYFSLSFPEEIWELDENDLLSISYGQISLFVNKYQNKTKYPSIKKVEEELQSYYSKLKIEYQKTDSLPQDDAFYQGFKMEKEDILYCFEMAKSLDGRYGITTVAEALFGERSPKMIRFHLDKHELFGKLSYSSYNNVRQIMEKMVEQGFMIKIGEEYPKLFVTKKGTAASQKLKMKTKKEFMTYDWSEGKIQLKNLSYTKQEKMLYLDEIKKENGWSVYREVLDLLCEKPIYARFVLDWMKKEYKKELSPIFTLYAETKKRGHVTKLLQDIQGGWDEDVRDDVSEVR